MSAHSRLPPNNNNSPITLVPPCISNSSSLAQFKPQFYYLDDMTMLLSVTSDVGGQLQYWWVRSPECVWVERKYVVTFKVIATNTIITANAN